MKSLSPKEENIVKDIRNLFRQKNGQNFTAFKNKKKKEKKRDIKRY